MQQKTGTLRSFAYVRDFFILCAALKQPAREEPPPGKGAGQSMKLKQYGSTEQAIYEILDQTDPISQAYVLEVGSAGLERELNRTWHFDASIGELVRARAIRPIDGEREWIGVLHAWEKEQITLEIEGTLRTLPLADLAFVKRYEEFEF